MPISVDVSLLPAADWSFVVVADTHYFADPSRADPDAVAEFPSRAVQGDRAGAIWQTIAALDPLFVVHMGDLVQEYPGRADFTAAQQEALAQIDAVGLRSRTRFVAGNHDVGDKPDPTMPTHAVGEADLRDHETRFGASYEAWQHDGLRFLSINSQILNTDLAGAHQQRQWLEEQLSSTESAGTIGFLHLPLYLRDVEDPHLGHYDTVAEPDRSWLLQRLQQIRLQHLFAAHVHFRFYDQIETAAGQGEVWICPSSCFTRPGFGQLFAAPPAPERGRNDVPKLGFYYCRVHDRAVDVLFIPTGDGRLDERRLLTPTTSASPSHLGASLTHPLVSQAQVPLAYPSLVRQPVRNDYPLLLLRELGVGHLRVPCADLSDPLQATRLRWLREAGCRLQATALGLGTAAKVATTLAGDLDRLEVQLTGAIPDAACLRRLVELDVPLSLCAIVPGDRVGGKQHPRTRVGYRREEIGDLPSTLAAGDVALLVCAPVHRPLTAADLAAPISPFALQLRLALEEASLASWMIVRGLVQAAAWNVPVFVEPLIDLDRTMDGASGLLDPLCNPSHAYEAARILGTVLARSDSWRVTVDDNERFDLHSTAGHLRLWPPVAATVEVAAAKMAGGQWIGLDRGVVAEGHRLPADWQGPVGWWSPT